MTGKGRKYAIICPPSCLLLTGGTKKSALLSQGSGIAIDESNSQATQRLAHCNWSQAPIGFSNSTYRRFSFPKCHNEIAYVQPKANAQVEGYRCQGGTHRGSSGSLFPAFLALVMHHRERVPSLWFAAAQATLDLPSARLLVIHHPVGQVYTTHPIMWHNRLLLGFSNAGQLFMAQKSIGSYFGADVEVVDKPVKVKPRKQVTYLFCLAFLFIPFRWLEMDFF